MVIWLYNLFRLSCCYRFWQKQPLLTSIAFCFLGRMEYEGMCRLGCCTASHLGDMGWHFTSSFSLEVVDCGCGRWLGNASRDLWFPTLSRINGCPCSLACYNDPSHIYLVEFYQGWCWIENIHPPEEGEIVWHQLVWAKWLCWNWRSESILSLCWHFFWWISHTFLLARVWNGRKKGDWLYCICPESYCVEI